MVMERVALDDQVRDLRVVVNDLYSGVYSRSHLLVLRSVFSDINFLHLIQNGCD